MESTRSRKSSLFEIALAGAALAALIATGCAERRDIEFSSPTHPRYISPPQHTAAPAQTADGSLYVDGSRVASVSDFRARDVNDLVTIVVSESTTATNSANVETERNDSSDRGLTQLLGLQKLIPSVLGSADSLVDADTVNSYESDGTNSRRESITSKITARVIQRLPNGNLVVQGIREVIVNHERQTMLIQGIVRPYDIDDTNSVPSYKVADLQIRYSGTGVLTENLRRGWFSRFLDYIWPL